MTSGAFITIEGGDGAGKTSQIAYITEQLVQQNLSVLQTREPGGTVLGEKLRALLLHEKEYEISNDSELLLMFASRCQHIEEVITPALRRNQWVLCDRFTDASFAYQGGGRGVSKERIQTLNLWVNRGLQADLTILLDVPVIQGQQRTEKRNQQTDRFEQQDSTFKENVRQVYLQLAQENPQRIKVVDASLSVTQVQQQVDAILTEFTNHFVNGGEN